MTVVDITKAKQPLLQFELMNTLLSRCSLGIIGDSHSIRMSTFLHPEIRIIGRGGERVSNFERYLEQIQDLDVLLIFLGGNDITGKNGAPGKSALKDMVNDVRALSSWAQSKGVKVLTCDIIPRETNLVGTDLSNKRLLKRFKKRHLTIRYFAFKMLSGGVHLENYADLWEYMQPKILDRIRDAFRLWRPCCCSTGHEYAVPSLYGRLWPLALSR